MTVKDITTKLEEWAPLAYQESYDNCGLLIGSQNQKINGILITLDITEAVIDEAIHKQCNLIISHHPLIFGGVKKVTDEHWVGRCAAKAIKNDLSIYAIHTNLDNVISGVNGKIAENLELQDVEVLLPKTNTHLKLVTFVPSDSCTKVTDALFAAGAGEIGKYKECSFQVEGIGSFLPSEESNPIIGTSGKVESVNEKRIEVILPYHLQSTIVRALKEAHPYEEVAYFITQLQNNNLKIGSGIIGSLSDPMNSNAFLQKLKTNFNLQVIRHTEPTKVNIQKIAICGGSGAFLIPNAIARKADVFISSDIKYHDFFETNQAIMLADIGHYESEVITKELIYDYLSQKFANIAFHLSEVITNPIIYS